MPKIHKKGLKKLKEDFLIKLRENNGLTYPTCQAIQISYNTYTKWFKEDEEFRNECLSTDEEQVEYVESKLNELIREGNVTAIIFYLKCRRPAKWNDKAGQQININITGTEFQLGGGGMENVKFSEFREIARLEEGEIE